jgi:microcystin-dependent protein
LGTDVNKPEVDVTDGYFTVELDFGSVFDGNDRWLLIGVRPGELEDPNVYTLLSPRQEVTPTPYALYAKTAGADNDWMVSGNNMYSIPSGNVGIGTTDPEKKLDIASESYTGLGICLRSKLPGGTSWDIDNDGGVFKIIEHAGCGPEFLNNTRIAVVGNCIGSPYGGNVGIGTTNPATTLDVNGTARMTGFQLGTSATAGNVLTTDANGIGSWNPVSAVMPAGIILPYGGTSVPVGWLIADGSAVSRTSYANLFAAIGTTYGSGDGSTTFNLPNLVNKFARGSATPGTGAGADTHTHAAGSYAGPSHTHGVSGSTSTYNGVGQTGNYGSSLTHSHSHTISLTSGADGTGAITGTSASGDNVPAYEKVMYIIKI